MDGNNRKPCDGREIQAIAARVMKVIPGILYLALVTMWLSATESAASRPVMVDPSHGWKLRVGPGEAVVSYSSDGGQHWFDVSPPALAGAVKKLLVEHREEELAGAVTLCPVDARRAWISNPLAGTQGVLLGYTGDAGQHWQQVAMPVATDRAAISFLDELRGFVLCTSTPAAGLMDKKVYGTVDGGKHWQELNPPPATSCYPTGTSFRSPVMGWITATYHGGDNAPLYLTKDGGKSWQLQKLNIPDDYRGGYADTYPPVFIGSEKRVGYLPVKLVRHDPKPGHSAWVNYETEDGGMTWHLPASGVQSAQEE